MVTPLYISFVLSIEEREIRDGLKCMCAVVIIILDRVPTCVGAALSQIPTGFFRYSGLFLRQTFSQRSKIV